MAFGSVSSFSTGISSEQAERPSNETRAMKAPQSDVAEGTSEVEIEVKRQDWLHPEIIRPRLRASTFVGGEGEEIGAL